MPMKDLLIGLIEDEQKEEERLEATLSEKELEVSNTYEDWSAKDTIAHIADWMRGEAVKLSGDDGDAATYGSIDEKNKALFERYKDKSWEEIRQISADAAALLKSQIMARTEEEIGAPHGDSDSRNRPVWRRAAGYGVLHPVSHIGHIYARRRDFEYAIALHEKFIDKLQDLNRSEEAWQGTLSYDLACINALAGKKLEAVDKLRESLRLEPYLVEWSKKDPDLASLRGMDEYKSIY